MELRSLPQLEDQERPQSLSVINDGSDPELFPESLDGNRPNGH